MSTTPHFPIYLDYSATTPCDPRVVEKMIPWLHDQSPTAHREAETAKAHRG